MASSAATADAARVVDSAAKAWECYGDEVNQQEAAINGHGVMPYLVAHRARRIEYVVTEDDPDVWEMLSSRKPAQSWQLCALVPLRLLGVAHDKLQEHDYELQAWWIRGGGVAFGRVETA